MHLNKLFCFYSLLLYCDHVYGHDRGHGCHGGHGGHGHDHDCDCVHGHVYDRENGHACAHAHVHGHDHANENELQKLVITKVLSLLYLLQFYLEELFFLILIFHWFAYFH